MLTVFPSQLRAGDRIKVQGGWYTVTAPPADPYRSTTDSHAGLVCRIPVEGGLTPMVSWSRQIETHRDL